jgi:hypothetical protein
MAPGLVNQFFVFGGMSSMDQQHFMYIFLLPTGIV